MSLIPASWKLKFTPRLLTFLLLTAALFCGLLLLAPHQATVAVYKLTLISLAAVVGYWLDRALFPYARPDGYLVNDWRTKKVTETGIQDEVDHPVIHGYRVVYSHAMLRRALIVLAVVLGTALGL